MFKNNKNLSVLYFGKSSCGAVALNLPVTIYANREKFIFINQGEGLSKLTHSSWYECFIVRTKSISKIKDMITPRANTMNKVLII